MLTRHAQARSQQRGISSLQLDLIRVFGEDHHQKGGCSLSFISRKRLNELRQALDRVSNVAVVKSPQENVVTVMHMDRRIHRTQYSA